MLKSAEAQRHSSQPLLIRTSDLPDVLGWLRAPLLALQSMNMNSDACPGTGFSRPVMGVGLPGALVSLRLPTGAVAGAGVPTCSISQLPVQFSGSGRWRGHDPLKGWDFWIFTLQSTFFF